jgi:hypothetical protein
MESIHGRDFQTVKKTSKIKVAKANKTKVYEW